jgi:CubicO group peptidase (beta-lactamase class C family)
MSKQRRNQMTVSPIQPDIQNADQHGFAPERLVTLRQTIEADTSRGTYNGAEIIVAHGGSIAMHEAIGYTNVEEKRKANINDIYFIMSLTKQMTVVRVLMDIENGKFDLTTRIAEIIPEFGIKGKQNITVWHILTHTSGLNTEIPVTLPLDKLGEIEAVTSCLCNERLLYLPGTIVTYNATTAHSVLAVMVQRLDKENRPFRRILAEDLFEPLGMNHTALGLPDRLKERLVPIVVRDKTPGMFDAGMIEAMNFFATEESEMPAGGAVSTALDVFQFTEMLRKKGEHSGLRFLSPASIQTATTNQTGAMPNHLMDYMREMYGWPNFPAYLGLSFFLRGEGVFPMPFGLQTSPETFGGLGAGSTMFWVDPKRDLTFIFLSAGLMEEGKSYLRFQRLSDMVVSSFVG